MKNEDIQITEARKEIEQYSKQIGELESLDKEKWGNIVQSQINFLKLQIKLRYDAIRSFAENMGFTT